MNLCHFSHAPVPDRPVQRLTAVVLLLSMAVMFAFAGNTGKISGVVKDKKTGEELVGVNVVILGSTQGAATDINGKYSILNVRPGTYTLIASMVGYSQTRINDVVVKIDLTTTVDIELSETVISAGQEVVVTATRPLVQKDQTASTAVVGRDQLAALPVTEFSQALNLQAGFVAGSVRGGRSGEVAYWIDGVPVTDAYDGSQVVEVNKSIIQEAQLVSGAYNAEYGQAMSGIVNIATREGARNFSGTFGYYGGDYLSADSAVFPGVNKFNPASIYNFEGSLSGPIIGEDLTFIANARYIYFGGYLYGYRRFNPSNVSLQNPSNSSSWILYRDPATGKGDSDRVSMNWSKRLYLQGKLTWRISSMMKLTYNYLYDNNTAKAYDRMYFYNPDGKGNTYSISNTQIFQFTHTLSQNAFMTVGGSIFQKDIKYYLYENAHDPNYVHPNVFVQPTTYSFYTGGTDLGRFHRSTDTYLGKVDLSWQMDQQNLIKVGVEGRSHKLFVENITLTPERQSFNAQTDDPHIVTVIQPDSTVYTDRYEHKPIELSAYIQDKMEFKDIIVNIGIRVDYFDPDGNVLTDEEDPQIFNPIKPNNRFFDLNGNGLQDPGERTKYVSDRRSYWYKKASRKIQVSPRFGASFPITDRGVVHFSYGYFFQAPRFERLYENPNFKLGNGNYAIVGNADLDPEQTIKGELGVQQALSDDISVDLTAYFQDIRNLTSTRGKAIVTRNNQTYYKYVNSDFGLVKGIALSVDKRFAGGLAASLYYTYQVARGTASDPGEALAALQGGKQADVQMVALGWDQRHTLNATFSYNGGFYGGSLIAQYGSGTPYTPRASQDLATILTNSEIKPSFFKIDMRVYYELRIADYKFLVFANLYNLLDTRNETGVFDDTGRGTFTYDEQTAMQTNQPAYVNTIHQFFQRPTNFSEPRRLEFGFNFEF